MVILDTCAAQNAGRRIGHHLFIHPNSAGGADLRLRRNLEPWLLTKSGKRMAEKELEKRMKELNKADPKM